MIETPKLSSMQSDVRIISTQLVDRLKTRAQEYLDELDAKTVETTA